MIAKPSHFKAVALCAVYSAKLAYSQNLSTHGSCSPIINGNAGTISVRCTISGVEARVLEALKQELQATANTLRVVNQANTEASKSILAFKAENSINKDRLTAIEKNLNLTRSRLEGEHNQAKFQLERLKQRLDDIAAETKLDGDFARALIADVSDSLDIQIEKQELKLSTLSATVAEHSIRITALEKDVSFLMDRFSTGGLEEGVFLLGSKVGTGSLPQASFVEAALELDYLTTYSLQGKWPLAATFSFGRIQSSYEKAYPTFSGAPSVTNHFSNSSNYMVLAGKVILQPIAHRIYPFLGLSLTYYNPAAKESRQTLGLGLAGGLDWAIASSRFSVELSFRQIPAPSYHFTFNPYGSSYSDTQAKKFWRPSVALKYAFR